MAGKWKRAAAVLIVALLIAPVVLEALATMRIATNTLPEPDGPSCPYLEEGQLEEVERNGQTVNIVV